MTDEITLHINYFNIGAFYEALVDWTGIEWPVPAPTPNSRFELKSGLRHMTFHLKRLMIPAESRLSGNWNDFLLEKVSFSAMAPLPFKLVATSETPETARRKLTTVTFEVGRDAMYHVSYA